MNVLSYCPLTSLSLYLFSCLLSVLFNFLFFSCFMNSPCRYMNSPLLLLSTIPIFLFICCIKSYTGKYLINLFTILVKYLEYIVFIKSALTQQQSGNDQTKFVKLVNYLGSDSICQATIQLLGKLINLFLLWILEIWIYRCC